MTYRDELQKLIGELHGIYDRVGTLRDYSGYESNEGKQQMNNCRGLLMKVWTELQQVDEYGGMHILNQKLGGKE